MKKSSQYIIEKLINKYPNLTVCKNDIEDAIKKIINCYKNENKILICGNGGSASDAQHIAGELMKSFKKKRKLKEEDQVLLKEMFPHNSDYYLSNLEGPLRAISLVGETSLITAYSNDKAPDLVFAQQILGLGDKGDILLAISTSGNSSNVIYGCEIAKLKGMDIIGLSGVSGGKMKSICDICITVPETETYLVQEYHLPIYHCMCLVIEEEFFGED